MNAPVCAVFVMMFCVFFANAIFAQEDSVKDMNDYVIKAVLSYPTDGTHDYWWPKDGAYDGATTDVLYMNKKVMRGEPKGRSYCCGFTLEIFYKVLNQYMNENKMTAAGKLTPENAGDFKTFWFVREKNGDGPGDAMIKYGCGIRINDIKDAKRGDFIQIWRFSGSGHSVILWDVNKDKDGQIVSIKYFSTQPGTKGVNFNTETIGKPKGIDLSHTHISRMTIPSSWK